MKYYYFNGKIFKSHNYRTACTFANTHFAWECPYGYKKRIKDKIIRLYDFDKELDK